MGRAVAVTSLLIDTVLTPFLSCPLLLAVLGLQPAIMILLVGAISRACAFSTCGFCSRQQVPWLFPWVFSSGQRGQRTSFQIGRTICVELFCCFVVSVTRPNGAEPWCLNVALQFDYPVVNGCLFCCLLCPVCMEATYCCSAMALCACIVGGNFCTITCRQIRLAHSSVCQGSHTLAHPSDLRLGKGCKTLLSLSLAVLAPKRFACPSRGLLSHGLSRHHIWSAGSLSGSGATSTSGKLDPRRLLPTDLSGDGAFSMRKAMAEEA